MGENKGAEPEAVDAASDSHTVYEGDDMVAPTKQRNTSAAFSLYPKEFLSSSKVLRMSNTEVGVYTKLLCISWLDDGLSTDLSQLARLVGVPPRQFSRMWAGPLGECFIERSGKFRNPRQEELRKELIEYRIRQAANGAKGGRPNKAVGSSEKAVGSFGLSETEPKKRSSSPSSLPSSSPDRHVPRPNTLIQKRRLDAAWEGGRVYVPQRTHTDLVGYRNGNEAELLTWYAEVDEHYAGEIDPDMFAFWRARYREKWPPSESKPKSRFADWKPREAV